MRITPQEVAAKVEPIMAHYGLKPVPFIRAPSRSSVFLWQYPRWTWRAGVAGALFAVSQGASPVLRSGSRPRPTTALSVDGRWRDDGICASALITIQSSGARTLTRAAGQRMTDPDSKMRVRRSESS